MADYYDRNEGMNLPPGISDPGNVGEVPCEHGVTDNCEQCEAAADAEPDYGPQEPDSPPPTCQHCFEPIGLVGDRWVHHPNDGPDAYVFCCCTCVACTAYDRDIKSMSQKEAQARFERTVKDSCRSGEEATP